MSGDGAFFPSDARMEKVSKNGGKSIRDDAVKPEELVTVKDNTGQKSIDEKIENSKNDTNDGKFADALSGFGGIV